ncbi:MAG: sugar ABC transporter permease [Defluviitaleaceae bacterium]|nr:sugar ABC transporter permease [Defluviitaleaceae bacterium]
MNNAAKIRTRQKSLLSRVTGKENAIAFSFLIPSLAGVALFYVIPFFMSLGYATTDSSGNFTGIENFANLFNSEAFRLASRNTFRFMVVAIPLSIAIPLVIACLLFNLKRMGRLKTIFMSPLVIPTASTAFFFQSLFTSNGFVSSLLGVNTDWLQTDHAFTIAVGLYIWKNLGFNLVLALAARANIPKEYYEWSAVEGMGKIRMFFKITIIYLVPGLFIMFVMSFINSFRIYRELYMLSGNYPHQSIYMLQHYMNNQFMWLNRQNLTTSAFVVTFVIAAFMVAFFIIDKKSHYGE